MKPNLPNVSVSHQVCKATKSVQPQPSSPQQRCVELALPWKFGHPEDRMMYGENRGQRQAVMSRYNQALLLESLKLKIIQTSGLFDV